MLDSTRVVSADYLKPDERNLQSIGECKRVSITCISEVAWWDVNVRARDFMSAGGPKEADQWRSPWTPSNAAGASALVEVESLDGAKTRFLVDVGCNVKYMDERFKAHGVDRMLRQGEVDFLYITHEHLDHFWGLEAVLKYNPNIKIVIPSTFQPSAFSFLAGDEVVGSGVRNSIAHKGELVILQVGEMVRLLDGVVSVGFDIPILLKIRGEQSLFFNVEDLGLVLLAGCCHQNVITLADYATNHLQAQGKLYGLYGGLHIAPFGSFGDEEQGWVDRLGEYGFKKIAANHCTGLPAIRRMIEKGYPVMHGSGSNGSQSDLYIGNGDSVVFG
ncbi:MBL fold metallo-hydrolase [Desulfomonile tiedjei]|uniref:Metal-dependent hydrolase, beta-lactamase superfamily II n=1 Tax=Desulfomonile tiedjei (strain ATCC 49306 / DSM 6799 / DCB-1) TaxID=706587 RepID=I4C540_DESTA|nr:MBL fold metallo-hydrolase [Desulfomonile tiedjei]AFM24681.1 metal-dependent hydrolase, beta-lactamase superfamily II [Desulfomonile tiedjei DSM 6799]